MFKCEGDRDLGKSKVPAAKVRHTKMNWTWSVDLHILLSLYIDRFNLIIHWLGLSTMIMREVAIASDCCPFDILVRF